MYGGQGEQGLQKDATSRLLVYKTPDHVRPVVDGGGGGAPYGKDMCNPIRRAGAY